MLVDPQRDGAPARGSAGTPARARPPRSRSVNALSSFVSPIGRAWRKSYSVPVDRLRARPGGPARRERAPATGRPKHERVDRRRPQREVGMRPGPVRARVGADVRRRRTDREAALREPVLDAERERERVAGLGVDHVLHAPLARLRALRRPGRPADEPVDRVAEPGLRQRQLMALPVELVLPVLDAVRPRERAAVPGPRGTAPPARSRPGRRARRPSTCGGRRRPPRPPPAGGRT